MELSDFIKEISEEISTGSIAYGDGSCAQFVSIFAGHLINAEAIPDFIPSFYMGTGKSNRKIRVDGYIYDDFDNSMNLIIADYDSTAIERTLRFTEANRNLEYAVRFIDEALHNNLSAKIEISTVAADLIDEILLRRTVVEKYRILLFTNGKKSESIDTIDTQKIDDVPVEFQIWDIERIYNIIKSTGKELIEINFTDYIDGGIPCLDAHGSVTSEYRSFLCVVPGVVIADIYDKYGARLLEGNVRSFLSTKGAVNKDIRKTIIQSPEMFFAFNNGVAATAKDVVINTTSSGKFITHATDFQIINGGQTTASLSSARFKDKASLKYISLQMKLTEIINAEDQNKEMELTSKISRSSNSQNKVSAADFFSTHQFHIRMENFSRKLWAPATGGSQNDSHWFYERARGQYSQSQMKLTKSERNKFLIHNPKSQLFSKTDLAKVRNTWSMKPHIVSRGAQTNFTEFANYIGSEWDKSDSPFNEKYFKESVALLRIFKDLEKSIDKQSWYSSGYRANLITYSMAWFHDLVSKQFKDKIFDLSIIWNKQASPEILISELTTLAKMVLDSITDPSRPNANVTQWCKKEECWRTIKSIPYNISPIIEELCINKNEDRESGSEAIKEQKFVNGIDAQRKVLELGKEYFVGLKEFIRGKLFLSSKETIALNIACNIPIKLPTDYQCIELFNLISRAENEGWLG